jgi:hypothetical protein
MNYRLQLSPISGSRESRIDLPSCELWEDPFSNWENAKFYRSWLVYDSDPQDEVTRGRMNWSVVLGLTSAAVVSISFWVGAGLLLARFWK